MSMYSIVKMSPLLGLEGSGGGLGYLVGGASGYPDDSFWISEADKSQWGDETPYDVAGDNEGNIYAACTRVDAGGNNNIGTSIVKRAADGTVSWQKVYYKSAYNTIDMSVRRIVAEAAGDHIYFCGYSNSGLFVTKVNKSDGSVDWRRQLGTASGSNLPLSIVLGSNGNPIVIATMDADSGKLGYFNLNKSDGTDVWKTVVRKTSGDATSPTNDLHAKLDSSGNIHSVVWGVTSHPNYYSGIVKHNSSGVLQSISDYQSSYSNEDMFSDVAVDSSGNKYVAFRFISQSGEQFRLGVMKVNSSDVIQWQRAIVNPSPNYMTPKQIEVLPEDAGIILSIQDRQNQGDSGDCSVSFIRFDTSGNVTWKRQFGVDSYNLSQGDAGKMRINRNGNIIFNTYYDDGTDQHQIVAQLPADGSLTGNYTLGSRTYKWLDNTRFSFSDQTIYTKQGSSIFSSDTNNNSNAAYSNDVTTSNNVKTFTKEDVD